MADKTVNFVGRPMFNSTISDFYTRLQALRNLNSGTTTITHSAPGAGVPITLPALADVRDEIINTKSALNFLANVDITTHDMRSGIVQGEKINAVDSVHSLEYNIGQLESACFIHFGSNRTTVKLTNFVDFQNQVNPACITQFTNHKAAQNSSNYGTNKYPVCLSVNTAFNGTHRSSFNSGFHGTFRSYNHTSHFSGECSVFGNQYKSRHGTFYATFYNAHRAPHFANFVNQRSCATVFGTNYDAHNGAHHIPHYAQFFSANNVSNDTTNFTSFTTSYHANHASFTVSPLR